MSGGEEGGDFYSLGNGWNFLGIPAMFLLFPMTAGNNVCSGNQYT